MNNRKPIRLTSNENCYGCSPQVLAAINGNYKDVHLYPQMNPVALKVKLAVKHGVDSKCIVTSIGSVGIIDALIQAFVGQGGEVLTFEKSFIAYGQLSEMHNRKCNFAPLTDFRCDPAQMLPLINNNTRLIFIANPNNPTGTIIHHNELENFLAQVPKNIIVAIDEAYGEYVTDVRFPDSISLQANYPNLVILHSFSKIYGLAGLRIGYAIVDEQLAPRVNQPQIPFSLNYLSYVGAIAALEDSGFIEQSAKLNAEQSVFLVDALKNLGYNTLPSQSNFIYLWFDTDAEKDKTYQALFINGILICDMKIFGQDKSLRITIGEPSVNQEIISILSFVASIG